MKYKKHLAAMKKSLDFDSLLLAATSLGYVRRYLDARDDLRDLSTEVLRLHELGNSVVNRYNPAWVADADRLFALAHDVQERIEDMIEHLEYAHGALEALLRFEPNGPPDYDDKHSSNSRWALPSRANTLRAVIASIGATLAPRAKDSDGRSA